MTDIANDFQISRIFYRNSIQIKTIFYDESENIIIGGDEDGIVNLWDLTDNSIITRLKLSSGGHTDELNNVVKVGNFIISGGEDKLTKVWNYD